MPAQPESFAIASGEVLSGGRFRFSNEKIVVAGDSLTDANWMNGGAFQWGLALARSPMMVCYNAGVAGENIDQLVDRWDTTVANHGAAAILTRIGTNNLSPSSLPGASIALHAKYQPIIDWHVANKVPGVIHAIPPEQDVPAAELIEVNSWLSAQCAAHPGLLYFANDSVDLGDAGYNYIADYFVDTTHMNGYGKRKQGERMAPVLRSLFGTRDIRISDGTDTYAQNPASNQLVTNPLMAGAGSIPTGWTATSYGAGTLSTQIIPADLSDPVQVPWARITPLTASAGSILRFRSLLDHPAYSTDPTFKRMDMVAEIRFVGLDASVFTMLEMGVEWVANGAVPSRALNLQMGFPEVLNDVVIARHGLEVVPPTNYAANSLQAFIRLTAAAGGYAVSPGSIDVRCVSVRARQD